MADAATTVPGTWFVTVTLPDGAVVRAVMTFTSDGGMVDRGEPRVEAGVGVWEAGDEENQFRFMFFRFLEGVGCIYPCDDGKPDRGEQPGSPNPS